MKNKIFLFLGPPGSGKGTLSSMCVNQFGWVQLSTGDLCRQHIAQQTLIGREIKALIAEGKLVSDEIIAQMVADWVENQKTVPQVILFDGYPRTKNQAVLLYNLIQEKLSNFEIVLVQLSIDQDVLLDRILNRMICSNKACAQVYSALAHSEMKPKREMICDRCNSALVQRIDDTQESLKQRLMYYYQHEQAIIDFYKNQGLHVSSLKATQSANTLFEEFKKIAF